MSNTIPCIKPYINPIYDGFEAGTIEASKLNSSEAELVSAKREKVDYSENSRIRSWKDTAKDIGLIIAKTVLYPWGIYSLCRVAISRIAMTFIFPAQSIFVGHSEQYSDTLRKGAAEGLKKFIVRHVILEKNGIRYSGLLIGHPETINNGCWIMHATGNYGLIELDAKKFAKKNHKRGFNTLLINGPGVGRSKGSANPETMGDAQEIGISFLENAIKAHKIVLSGYSLGGAAIGQAVLKHEFKSDIQYTVVLDKTFDSLNHIIKCIFRKFHLCINLNLIAWLGFEMDTTAALKKLEDNKIVQIIIQKSNCASPSTKIPIASFEDDGVIPAEASLGLAMNQQKLSTHRYFFPSSDKHEILTPPFDAIDKILEHNAFQQFIKKVNEKLPEDKRYSPSREDLTFYEASEEIRSWLREHQELLKQITSLDLHKCIFRTFPSEIEYFINLDTLTLLEEQRKIVPHKILIRIGLQKNFINKRRFIEAVNEQLNPEQQFLFPNSESKLTNNEILDCIASWFCKNSHVLKEVTYLNLSGCGLTTLPLELKLFSGLKILNLSNNNLVSVNPKMLENFVQLKILDLSNNKIGEIPYSIGCLSKLEILDLSHNTISSLPPAVSNLQSLTTLDLSYNTISLFPPAISSLQSIETLDLSGNPIALSPPLPPTVSSAPPGP